MNNTTVLMNSVVKGWIETFKAWLYEFFNPTLEGYVNFDFGSGEMLNVQIVIFGIFAGVLLASLYTIYVKNVVGAFVRKLLSQACLSEETAKTLGELGFSHNPFVRMALRGSLLASTVSRVCPTEETVVVSGEGSEAAAQSVDAEPSVPRSADASQKPVKKEKNDPQTVRYYIKEEKKYIAEMRFNARGSGWPTFFFVLLISVICVFLIFTFLPQILRFLDNTISIFSVAGNTVK